MVQPLDICYAIGLQEFRTRYPGIWEKAYKFMIVRNPYDRFISGWKFLIRFGRMEKVTLWEAVRGELTPRNTFNTYHLLHPQTQGLFDNGRLDVDFIVRYERLHQDLQTLCAHLGVEPQELGHKKAGIHQDYRTYYTPETARDVYHRFREDFEVLGYPKDSWCLNFEQEAPKKSFTPPGGSLISN